jgi:VanZ family protein
VADTSIPVPPPSLGRFYRLGLAAHTTLIAWISVGAYAGLLPTQIRAIPFYDTVLHFLLVGMFGFFLDGALAHRPIVAARFFPRLGPGIALLLAATEETLQRLSPRRSSSLGDFAANTIGILVCAWLAKRLTMAKAAQPVIQAPAAHGGAS